MPSMSFVTAAPEMVTSAASDLASIGSMISEAKAAAVGPTTGVVAAASDEVSAAIASLFSSHAQDFQALSTRAAAFHQRFVQLMSGGAAQYASTEAANLSSLQGLLTANVTQSLPNLGYGNIGSADIGFFNTGILNIGIGNTGNANVGIGNLSPNFDVPNPITITAFGGLGFFNNGIDNAGGWNTGVANVGFGNTGDPNTGSLPRTRCDLLRRPHQGSLRSPPRSVVTRRWTGRSR
jgi:PPE-repeat protein